MVRIKKEPAIFGLENQKDYVTSIALKPLHVEASERRAPDEELLEMLRHDVPEDRKRERIGKAWDKLIGDGQVAEIRTLTPSLQSGWFDNRKDFVEQAIGLEQSGAQIYFTPHSVNAELLDRSKNRMASRIGATKDADITGYRFLLVDIDPIRSKINGKKPCSTDGELIGAIRLARGLINTLEDWPTPVAWGCSGNGVHLYLPLELPASEKGLVNETLLTLQSLFGTDGYDIDSTVCNQARIFRLPGTTNRKGDNTPERPHRGCTLLPDDLLSASKREGVLTREFLEGFVSRNAPKKTPKATTVQKLGQNECVGAPLERHEWTEEQFEELCALVAEYVDDVGSPVAWNGGGQKRTLTGCILSDEHEVDNGAVLTLSADGRPGYTCHHDTCSGRNNIGYAFRALREKLTNDGRELPWYLEDQTRTLNTLFTLNAEGNQPWNEVIPLESWDTPEWPVGLMPKLLEEFTDAISDMNQTPPAQSKVMSIPVLSACLQERYQVEIGGRTEVLTTYVCNVAESGERKTADLKPLLFPISQFERESELLARDAQRDAQADIEILTARREHLKKHAVRTNDLADREAYREACKELAEMELPQPKRLLAQDITPEKLIDLMSKQNGAISLISGEGGPLDGMVSRYQKQQKLSPIYLSGYSAERIQYDRKSADGPTSIESPRLTMGVMTQPSHLKGVLAERELAQRGAIERFIWSVPSPRIGYREIPEDDNRMPNDLQSRYNDAITGLLPDPAPRGGEHDPTITLQITGQSRRLLKKLEKELEERFRPNGDLYEVKGWGARIVTKVAKVATLWHIFSYSSSNNTIPRFVEPRWVKNAIRWGREFLIPMGVKTLSIMGVSKTLSLAIKIAELIRAHKYSSFTKNEMKTHLKATRSAEFEPAYKLLEEHNIVRRKKEATSGRPRTVFEVNPGFLSSAKRAKRVKSPRKPPVIEAGQPDTPTTKATVESGLAEEPRFEEPYDDGEDLF